MLKLVNGIVKGAETNTPVNIQTIQYKTCLVFHFYMPAKKSHLPTKICVTCGRPFTWRKKWEKVWEAVKYCSERCRRERKPA